MRRFNILAIGLLGILLIYLGGNVEFIKEDSLEASIYRLVRSELGAEIDLTTRANATVDMEQKLGYETGICKKLVDLIAIASEGDEVRFKDYVKSFISLASQRLSVRDIDMEDAGAALGAIIKGDIKYSARISAAYLFAGIMAELHDDAMIRKLFHMVEDMNRGITTYKTVVSYKDIFTYVDKIAKENRELLNYAADIVNVIALRGYNHKDTVTMLELFLGEEGSLITTQALEKEIGNISLSTRVAALCVMKGTLGYEFSERSKNMVDLITVASEGAEVGFIDRFGFGNYVSSEERFQYYLRRFREVLSERLSFKDADGSISIPEGSRYVNTLTAAENLSIIMAELLDFNKIERLFAIVERMNEVEAPEYTDASTYGGTFYVFHTIVRRNPVLFDDALDIISTAIDKGVNPTERLIDLTSYP